MAAHNDSRSAEPANQSSSDTMTLSGGAGAGKDAGPDAFAPYGTRSRNRGGTSRINYAEDKDIEMDNYDYYQDKKEGEGSKKTSRTSSVPTINGESGRAGGVARKAAVDDGKVATSQNSAAKEVSAANNGAQAAQAQAALQNSRKRKAATTHTANTATAVSTRRAGNATPSNGAARPDSNMLTFQNCHGRPDDSGRMVADDGTVLEANDHVYLVCEPPGEPYYLGRIMEFLHAKNDPSKPVDAVRINWFYRPKDIGRKAPDTRLVYASMHSDISPLTALRGKCQIRHRVEIDSLEEYRKVPDSFWYEKLYDRYIQKNYDLIPTAAIVNVPERVKKVLDERWKFVLVEQGRGKELTSAVKLCKRCTGYCASNDSVDCAVCQNTYHMNCVRPPLLKKPSRGFAWSCAACSRAQERKLEARHTPSLTDHHDGDDEDFLDEEDDEANGLDTNRTSPADDDDKHRMGTAEQIYHASLWPYRYLGMHCKPEDALDYDDRIYPRASTRIGPRHQANVLPWPGRPVEYVKPLELKRGKNLPKLSKEAQAAQEAEKALRSKRPKWVQDEPPGYTTRGEDYDASDSRCTATPLWIPPPVEKSSPDDVISYMKTARSMALDLQLPKSSTNLQDVALTTLLYENYSAEKALSDLSNTALADFKEPKLTASEEKKFEEAITKYGSELHLVMKHVKTMTPGQVVRYYYTWKKTERGHHVWGNYTGRKGKKQAKKAEAAATKLADDVADADDDSAFDSNKAAEKKRGFVCQFCSTTSSRQWRRAPNATQTMVDEHGAKLTAKDRANQPVVALCRRCAELWRRYAIRWEDVEEVAKKVAQAGGKAWKRKQDEELLKELQAAQDLGLVTPDRDATPIPTPQNGPVEPPRKKLKGVSDKDETAQSDNGVNKRKDRTSESSPVPEMPKPRTLPCAVCDQFEPLGDQHLSCRECRLTVHRACYGVVDNRIQGKWVCDMCSNDRSPQVSIHYKCVLCPIEHTEHEFVDQPKLTHHKKKMSEKDRERERLEVQQARKAAEFYRKRQEDLNRPVNPREPLKRTADNNWAHVTCAVWTPEVKFGNARAMGPLEGIPSIPRSKYDEICQVCQQASGACVSCHQCRATFHVECARQHGHLLGFDITPVKSSRRDQFSIVSIKGESGTMSALLWCKDHVPLKTIAHPIHEVVDDIGTTALQLYVQNYKQADLTLTGTVRKANLLASAAKTSTIPPAPSARRVSGIVGSSLAWASPEPHEPAANAQQPGEKLCISCGVDVTPRWWPIDTSQERRLTNGHNGAIGSEAQKFVEQRKFQCHKCRKMAKTPRPHASAPPSRGSETSQPTPADRGFPTTPAQLLRSPSQGSDYRDARVARVGWPQPATTDGSIQQHSMPQQGHPPPLHALQAPPPITQAQIGGPRVVPPPAPLPSSAHHYAPTPLPRSNTFNEWGRPPSQHGSQHGSPPRHINGSSPTLHAGPPPLSSLRPPPLTGPTPASVLTTCHQHAPLYANGLPPSPRRRVGPAPSSPYMSPYHGSHSQASPSAPHSLSNGGPSQPHPIPPRSDGFSNALQPRGPGFAGSGQHGTPGVAMNGLPPRDPSLPVPSPGSVGPPRGSEVRPPSGASASPSLRNLLS